MNGTWPSWLLNNGSRALDISNANLSGLGIGCIVPALNDPVNNLLGYLLIVPVITLAICGLVVTRITVTKIWIILQNKRYQSIEEDNGNEGKHDDLDSQEITSTHHDTDHGLSSHYSIQGEVLTDSMHLVSVQVKEWQWGLYLWLYALYLLFFELANRSLGVFNCVDEPYNNKSFMQSLPWVACSWDDSHYWKLGSMAVVGIVVYVVGIPVLFASLLWTLRKRTQDKQVRYWLGNLYYCYKDNLFWFELVIIIRRLALAALLFSLPQSSAYRAGGVIAVLVIAMVIHVWTRPFKEVKDNVLEAVALCTVTITFVAQTAWRFNILLDDPSLGPYSSQLGSVVAAGGDNEILLAVLAVGNMVVLGVMFAALGWDLWKWFTSVSSIGISSQRKLRTFYDSINTILRVPKDHFENSTEVHQ